MNADEFSEHVFGSLLGALDIISIHIGDSWGSTGSCIALAH